MRGGRPIPLACRSGAGGGAGPRRCASHGHAVAGHAPSSRPIPPEGEVMAVGDERKARLPAERTAQAARALACPGPCHEPGLDALQQDFGQGVRDLRLTAPSPRNPTTPNPTTCLVAKVVEAGVHKGFVGRADGAQADGACAAHPCSLASHGCGPVMQRPSGAEPHCRGCCISAVSMALGRVACRTSSACCVPSKLWGAGARQAGRAAIPQDLMPDIIVKLFCMHGDCVQARTRIVMSPAFPDLIHGPPLNPTASSRGMPRHEHTRTRPDPSMCDLHCRVSEPVNALLAMAC